MFTGVGGFELGFQQASERFKSVGCSEIEKCANQLLKDKFPGVKNYGDAKKIDPNKLPDFDLLCGGFPCQTFSIAGKRKGFKDTRGTLFFEIARILQVKRPKLVLLENVKGLLNHEEGQTLQTIFRTLDELGYEFQWMVLNSKFHGVPQNRERIFIIGNLRGTSKPKIFPFREREDKFINNAFSPTITTNAGSKGGKEVGSYLCYAKDEGRVAESIKEELFIKEKVRRLIPLEYERLQGFPDNWTEGFSDNQRYKMMGNAVTVNVIKVIGEKLIKCKY